ncbi:GL25989 [Drosophila persimilis]|uniref:Zinc finger protein Noc n=2 Tax=pseudoobscura subgroup TaxID=32358 RepID=Q29P47_DROPS|nr:zinc finger protein Noc [Drosophila pseudoobscura]XP_002018784.1 zinc finger protein Noc [Drosophila persimilis]EDW36980.1 GL25989 [Drosophila persimilis]
MVVLEGGGGVVTIGNNQYLQPDYLAPLPTTMDAKKSPLALLAQTCSQIGADSSAVKPLLAMDKNKTKPGTCSSSSTSSTSSSNGDISAAKSPGSQAKSPKSTTPITATATSNTSLTTTGEIKLAFKPYETNVLSHQNQNSFKSSSSVEEPMRPSSKNSSSAQERVPSRSKSNATPTDGHSRTQEAAPSTPHDNGSRKTVSPSGSSQRGASPIVRSGMEVLSNSNGTAQHPKEMSSMAAAAAAAAAAYKAAGPYGLNHLSALCCPPGMEQHANPAFRPPFAGGFSHHHAAMLAAAANGGYPGAGGGNPAGQPNPYISYQRIKTPAGGEAIVPVCKDPYCPGCPYSAHTQQMLMGAPCPAGCTQCEHQKYGMAMASAGLPPGHPYSQAAAAAAANAAAARSAPYVCSWVVGDAYCGKRFQTSDELFTHLRTHTGNLSDPAAAAAALAQSQAQSLLGTLFPPSALRGGYPTPPLSPMSAAAAAARYHPYAKPPPGSMGGAPSPFGAGGAFNPAAAAAAAALGPYYSPYAMYGQRMGAAHQ